LKLNLFSQTNPLVRKVITISFFIALVVALISSAGLTLLQTGGRFIGLFHQLKSPHSYHSFKTAAMDKQEKVCINLAEQVNISNIILDNVTHYEEGTTGSFASLTCDVSLDERDDSVCVIWKRRNNSIPRVDGVLSVGLSLHFKEVKATDSVSALAQA
jgi:hypothetical protein